MNLACAPRSVITHVNNKMDPTVQLFNIGSPFAQLSN